MPYPLVETFAAEGAASASSSSPKKTHANRLAAEVADRHTG